MRFSERALITGRARPLPHDDRCDNGRTPVLWYPVDLPSGMDADTGTVLGVAVCADVTTTMVAPKAGFTAGADLVGEVVIVDIGAPALCVQRARLRED